MKCQEVHVPAEVTVAKLRNVRNLKVHTSIVFAFLLLSLL